MASAPLQPTYHGLVTTTYDSLLLFEACLSGVLHHIPRRPHDRERDGLIRSGNVFIYEEHSSGIKRWTDGISWSPSRILGNFLVYRELVPSTGPNEKKRALKKAVKRPSTGGITKTTAPTQAPPAPATQLAQTLNSSSTSFDESQNSGARDPMRELVGSLTESYDFRDGGLVKKTISIRHRGVSHHLVSYYSIEDAQSTRLRIPSQDPELSSLRIREELLYSQTFRASITEGDAQNFPGGYIALHHPAGGGIQPHDFPPMHGMHFYSAPGIAFQPDPGFQPGPNPHPGFGAGPGPGFDPSQPPSFTPGPAPGFGAGPAPGFGPGPGFGHPSGLGPAPGPGHASGHGPGPDGFHNGGDESFTDSSDLQGFGLRGSNNNNFQ